jgi:hypothetical protein
VTDVHKLLRQCADRIVASTSWQKERSPCIQTDATGEIGRQAMDNPATSFDQGLDNELLYLGSIAANRTRNMRSVNGCFRNRITGSDVKIAGCIDMFANPAKPTTHVLWLTKCHALLSP